MTATGSDQFNGCGLLSCRLQLMNRTFALFRIFAFNAATSTVAVKFTVRVAFESCRRFGELCPFKLLSLLLVHCQWKGLLFIARESW